MIGSGNLFFLGEVRGGVIAVSKNVFGFLDSLDSRTTSTCFLFSSECIIPRTGGGAVKHHSASSELICLIFPIRIGSDNENCIGNREGKSVTR